jgi:hypothetical protein
LATVRLGPRAAGGQPCLYRTGRCHGRHSRLQRGWRPCWHWLRNVPRSADRVSERRVLSLISGTVD